MELAEYRARKAEQWLRHNERAIRREFWERKAVLSVPKVARLRIVR